MSPSVLGALLLAGFIIGSLVGAAAGLLRNALRAHVQVVEVIPSSTVKGAFDIPASAVIEDGGAEVVFVDVNGTLIRQPITFFPGAPGRDLVTVGLSLHAKVVVNPQGRHDGESVRDS